MGVNPVNTEHTHVADGKRPAGDLVHAQSAFAGSTSDIPNFGLEFFQCVGVGLLDIGDDETIRQGHGNTKIDVFMQMDSVFLKRGVHDRMPFERRGRRHRTPSR